MYCGPEGMEPAPASGATRTQRAREDEARTVENPWALNELQIVKPSSAHARAANRILSLHCSQLSTVKEVTFADLKSQGLT